MGSHGQKASVSNRWVLSREWRSSHTRHQRGRMFHCCRHYEAVEVISPSLISIHVGSNVECECNFNVCQCKMKSRLCPHECVRARSHAWSINCIAPRAWVGAWELRVCFFKTQHLFIRGREGWMERMRREWGEGERRRLSMVRCNVARAQCHRLHVWEGRGEGVACWQLGFHGDTTFNREMPGWGKWELCIFCFRRWQGWDKILNTTLVSDI